MHLTAQEEYGLRCLLRVAQHAGEKPLTCFEIAAAEGLSPEYAAKLLRVLRQGSLVVSVRGAGGGYRLAMPPAEITLWEAIAVLGGPLFPDTFCETHPGQERDCVHSPDCSIRAVWRAVDGALEKVLASVTLADLAHRSGESFLEVKFSQPELAASIGDTQATNRGSEDS